jgi:GT2 family glycosyltransferase/glycosyltransferase involved in cell wall biosynthesis
MSISGHVDGLEGSSLVGWAASQRVANCAISVIGADGAAIANGLADIERPDLAGVVPGRCNIAFRIKLPSLDPGLVHVLADGVELTNSPVHLGPGIFDGHMGVDGGGIVHGWIAERVPDFVPPTITLVDQAGDVVFETRSRIDGPVGAAQFIAAQFSGQIADRCFGAGERRLTAFARGTRFAEARCDLKLLGHLEQLDATRCSGWLFSPSAPHRPFAIDVLRDGAWIASIPCNRPRPDITAAHPGVTLCGFEASLPGPPPGCREAATITFRFAGGTMDLFEGPYVLADRVAAVQAARRVAQLTHGSGLSALETAVLERAIGGFLAEARAQDRLAIGHQTAPEPRQDPIRFTVVIPVYRDVEVTRICIDSVLAHRAPEQDRILLVNDRSPEPGMAAMLNAALHHPNVVVLTNDENIGFVRSVNRAMSFCQTGDIILLNADTRVFAGGLEELWRTAHAAPEIGTATAISNNATIFSYPHGESPVDALEDIGWEALAAAAIDRNRGVAIDAPTGHGFCLLIKREVIARIGRLDESFGRGYGDENDFCARAADLGYRNVLAPGAFVEHRENISFGDEKAALLARNLTKLQARYPEYTPLVMDVERCDDLRRGRWALDAARLEHMHAAGQSFVLVVHHGLGGGTERAIADIEAVVGYGGALRLSLCCRPDGMMELSAAAPLLRAVFAAEEAAELFRLLAAAGVQICLVHQLLGFGADFIAELADWIAGRHGVFFVHDYYPACPRVNLIDPVGQYCGVPDTDICARCVAVGGVHEASRTGALAPDVHRTLFGAVLRACKHVVAPSLSAAQTLRAAFPDIAIEVAAHPEPALTYPAVPRAGSNSEIVLFGALGGHKGSDVLLDLARLAQLRDPLLRFRVIGYTDKDEALRRVGNVVITGAYKPGELRQLAKEADGRFALFLSGWPETFGYTLSEAVSLGFVPLVPDIGALAERVRAAGFGVVYPYPIVAAQVLALLSPIARGRTSAAASAGSPAAFAPNGAAVERMRAIMMPTVAAPRRGRKSK